MAGATSSWTTDLAVIVRASASVMTSTLLHSFQARATMKPVLRQRP